MVSNITSNDVNKLKVHISHQQDEKDTNVITGIFKHSFMNVMLFKRKTYVVY